MTNTSSIHPSNPSLLADPKSPPRRRLPWTMLPHARSDPRFPSFCPPVSVRFCESLQEF